MIGTRSLGASYAFIMSPLRARRGECRTALKPDAIIGNCIAFAFALIGAHLSVAQWCRSAYPGAVGGHPLSGSVTEELTGLVRMWGTGA